MSERIDPVDGRWSPERARAWGEETGWLCGFNFLPSTAVNFLELWRAQTFDPDTIARELGWAQRIGFNALRTNLHYLDWLYDRDGTIDRLDRFLGIAAERGFRTMLCLFDDCEFSGDAPSWGPQPDPRPGVHNGRAIGSPGRRLVERREEWIYLRAYVQDVVSRFGADPRVVVWDLYNEPGNRAIFERGEAQAVYDPSLEPHSHDLMRATFAWAREAEPRQPLTVGAWRIGPIGGEAYADPIDKDALALSDVISFHAYCPLPHLRFLAGALEGFGRPVFCTEWMARTVDSRIGEQLPYFRDRNIGAFQWGLVQGRTQTHLPWPGFARETGAGAGEWFHDILTPDGAPYSAAELETLRAVLAAE